MASLKDPYTKMIRLIIVLVFLHSLPLLGIAQSPRFIVDIPPVDLPYQRLASQTYSQHFCGRPNCGLKGMVMAFGSPSMRQVTAASKSFHSAVNYGLHTLWNGKTTEKPNRKLVNVLGEFTTVLLANLVTPYLPLGTGWAHEEFHRNALMRRGLYSYNDIYKFNLLAESVSVSQVNDDELIRFKQNHPVDHIRAAEAGIEGEYQVINSMQKDGFFYNIRSGTAAPVMYLLTVIGASGYVRSCVQPLADTFTDEANSKETNIPIRDWVGLDFTAWVYDLHRPSEPYTNRGIHPSGVGIDRYIRYSDLTSDMRRYLHVIGNRQLLNYINPQNIGIRRIRLGRSKSGQERWGNIALRHYFTSFGDDMSLEVYYKQNDDNLYAVLHRYGNNAGGSLGVELQWIDKPLKLEQIPLLLTLRGMGWMQPKEQSFFTRQQQVGGLVGIQIRLGRGQVWQPYVESEAKTTGWVAGNPFLDANVSVRAGVMAFVN